MTAQPILEHLSREFKTKLEHVQAALQMIDAGLTAPFIGRYRRQQVGGLSESQIRRIERQRAELEELDRRKGTILRLLEKDGIESAVQEQLQRCMDRFEVEDLFLPHRRPEPEVQLALDRGLGGLADRLTAPLPKERRSDEAEAGGGEPDADAPAEPVAASADVADAIEASADATEASAEATEASADATEASADATEASAEAAEANADGTEASAEVTEASADGTEASAEATEASAEVTEASADATEASADAIAPEAAADPAEATAGATAAEEPKAAEAPATAQPRSEEAVAGEMLNPELARLCQEFVAPDRGVHNEAEALAGAMRVLSDRLARNARLRSSLRRMMRKQGMLRSKPLVDEKAAGRQKSLLKLNQPLRQIQGNRLLALRKAQKARVLTTRITLDEKPALDKVRQALGKHFDPAHAGVLEEVCRQALHRRLLPMIEEDIRLELKERADREALRFLGQHLRQMLLTPVLPPRARVVGIDVNAKGDWNLVVVDQHGRPTSGEELKIETAEKDAAALGAELAEKLGGAGVDAAAVSSSKGSRAALTALRAAFKASGLEAFVFVATEAGLSNYVNSELARKELADFSVSQRMAISVARRLQDPMLELLKVDPRHLSLGSEQALVSKANVRRNFLETIESCAAHVGCDVNRAPAHFLAALPGLDEEAAARLVARREEAPIRSRDELRDEGVLTEAQWASAAGFLRVYDSPEPLDRSNLHPEQYVLARRLIEAVGGTIDDSLGRPGVTRGLKREDFDDIDPETWRDLMRELSHPGRDPRHRVFAPRLLDANADPAVLTKDRIVEGVVTNVTGFGAFVDIGLEKDAVVHISEVSDHYVRDSRELVSVGQVVRARLLDATPGRITLSLKNVPRERREEGRGGRGARGPRKGGRDRQDDRPRVNPNLRAAQSRRDGLGGTGGGGGRRGDRPGRGGGPGRGGPGRGGPGQGRRRERGEGEEYVDLRKLNQQTEAPKHNPFAAFFKGEGDGEGGSEA